MRVGIFGSYNYASLGDHAILEGIISQFEDTGAIFHATVFAMDVVAIEELLSHKDNVKVTKGNPRHLARRKTINWDVKRLTEYQGSTIVYRMKKLVKRHQALLKLVRSVFKFAKRVKYGILFYVKIWFWRQKLIEIRELDVMLIGGGNILMDLFKRWPRFLIIYSMLAKLAGTPLLIYSVGAGPIRTGRGKLFMKVCCYLADYITLRDKESLDLVKKILTIQESKLILSADPAVCLRSGISTPRKRKNTLPFIGVTVVPYYSPWYWPEPNPKIYEKYLNQMANLLDSILKCFRAKIVFFATNHPTDLKPAKDVFYKMQLQDHIEIVEERLKVPEIINLISSCDVTICTRLHSSILSLVAGTPFLAISYQPKVTAFCKRIGLEDYIIPLSEKVEFKHEQVLNQLRYILEHRDDLSEHCSKQLSELREAAQISTNLVCEVVRERARFAKVDSVKYKGLQ